MAMRHAVLANEHQRVTFPVAFHEAFEISGIPSLFLQSHDLSHLLWHPREGDRGGLSRRIEACYKRHADHGQPACLKH